MVSIIRFGGGREGVMGREMAGGYVRAADRVAVFICWPEIGDHDRERDDLSAGYMVQKRQS